MTDEKISRDTAVLGSAYLDGSADKEQLERLLGLLRSDEGARVEFSRLVDQHATLRRMNAGCADAKLEGWRAVRRGRGGAKQAPGRTVISALGNWFAAAALLVVAAGAYFGYISQRRQPANAPTAGQEEGAVAVLRPSGEGKLRRGDDIMDVKSPVEMFPGDRITWEEGSAAIQFIGEATAVEVSGAGEGALVSGGRTKKFLLISGTARVLVASQAAGKGMVLSTPFAEAEVIGTEFAVTVGEGEARLEVFEGRVKYTRAGDGANIEVKAGQYAIAGEGIELIARPAVTMYFEAEEARLQPPMKVLKSPGAFGGGCISTDSEGQGMAEILFNVPASGSYYIWCRVLAPESWQDSFHVSMDGGTEWVFDVAEGRWSNDWQWSMLVERTGEKEKDTYYTVVRPVALQLTRGMHRVVFRGREAHTMLDRVVLTNDPDFKPAR
ncbi:MAG TPA: hypothetical protein ENN09_02290 [Planctomycetes bacterium]|nr:hypothetical protein [Planctomycetota bacterium]